jgi:hypothetical protein
VPGSSKLAAPAVHRLYDRSEIRPGLVLRRQMCPSASIGPKRAADRGRRLARAIQAPARGLVTKPDVLSRNVPNPPHVASMPERNSRGSRRAGPRGSRWVEPQGADNPPGNASPETYGGLCVPGVENPPHTGRGGNYGGLCPPGAAAAAGDECQCGASGGWALQRRDFSSRAIALADSFACLDMKPSAPGRLV